MQEKQRGRGIHRQADRQREAGGREGKQREGEKVYTQRQDKEVGRKASRVGEVHRQTGGQTDRGRQVVGKASRERVERYTHTDREVDRW